MSPKLSESLDGKGQLNQELFRGGRERREEENVVKFKFIRVI